MGAADKYEEHNLAEQAKARRAARRTVTVVGAVSLGLAAIVCAVMAAIVVMSRGACT